MEHKEKYFCIDTSREEILDFGVIFGDNKPITLEIGSGKGDFLANQSRIHPEMNYIGIEVKSKRIITILKKLDIVQNSNVRLLNLFVDANVNKYIAAESIDEIIIYHPDPWPKTRHHRRRLFQPSFIDCLNKVIKKDGLIRISTDSLDYAKWIKGLFDKRQDFVSMYEEGFTSVVPEGHFWTYFDELQANAGYEPLFMLYKAVQCKENI